MATAKSKTAPTETPKPEAQKVGRLVNLHEYNRFRLELRTGDTYRKNGQDVPTVEVFWLLGRGDARPGSANAGKNAVPLTAEQIEQVRASKMLMSMVSDGLLQLEI